MNNIATREAYGQALVELGDLRDDIVVLDADLSKSTKTCEFAKKFPKRFFNMGIAEQNLIGAACGLSTTGKIPFVSTFAVFATGRGFEIIRNSVCYPNLNVKICATHAGITVGEDGASHQSIEDISIMRSIPNMTVLVPADGVEVRKMIFEISNYTGPVYVRLGRSSVPTIFNNDYDFKIGKGVILKDGTDATIIACGIMVNEAIKASEQLEEEGIDVRVINMPTIKPIDSAKKTGAIITAEEHSTIGGLGSAVSEVVTEEYPVIVKKIGVTDVFGQSGTPSELISAYGLTSDNIIKKVKIVWEDDTKTEYIANYKNVKSNVANYELSGLNVSYQYDKYIIKEDADLVSNLVDYAQKIDYTNDLDPLTEEDDSRLYRDYYNETTKNNIKQIVLKVLENIPLGQLGEVEDIANSVACLVNMFKKNYRMKKF